MDFEVHRERPHLQILMFKKPADSLDQSANITSSEMDASTPHSSLGQQSRPPIIASSSRMDALKEGLRSNLSALNSHEREMMQRERDLCIEEARKARARVKLAEARLRQCQAEAKEAEARSAVWKSMFAPIRSLPNEILSLVFEFACLGDKLSLYPVWTIRWGWKVLAKPTSHSLVHVCRHWRDVALETTEIWTHFVALNSTGHLMPGRLRPRWDDIAHLYHGKLVRLDLSDCAYHEVLVPVFEKLMQAQGDIVSFKVPMTYLVRAFTNLLGGPPVMPSLEHLSIHFRNLVYSAEGFKSDLLPTNMSKLTQVELIGSHSIPADSPHILRALPLPWQQLTHLSYAMWNEGHPYSQIDYLTLTHVLRSLVNIVSLHLGWVDLNPLEVEISTTERIVMKNLRVLELNDHLDYDRRHPVNNFRVLFPAMSTPALESVDFVLTYKAKHKDDEHIQRTIGSSTTRALVSTFLTQAPLLRSVRVAALNSAGTLSALSTSVANHRIMKFSGDSNFFSSLDVPMYETDNLDFLQQGQLRNSPFNKKHVVWEPISPYQFIDKILERGDRYFERPSEMGYKEQPIAGDRPPPYFGMEKLAVTRAVFHNILAAHEGVVKGERVAYFLV